jgi:hypothetical protein
MGQLVPIQEHVQQRLRFRQVAAILPVTLLPHPPLVLHREVAVIHREVVAEAVEVPRPAAVIRLVAVLHLVVVVVAVAVPRPVVVVEGKTY